MKVLFFIILLLINLNNGELFMSFLMKQKKLAQERAEAENKKSAAEAVKKAAAKKKAEEAAKKKAAAEAAKKKAAAEAKKK